LPDAAYTRYGLRVWDQICERTGHDPFYIDAERIASYCPACGDGTMLVRFLEHPQPGMAITHHGQPGCSRGCTEQQINDALFG